MAKTRTRRAVYERQKRSDRDSKGRFTSGNKAAVGHGRPLAGAVHALRAATFEALTPDLWRRIVEKQIEAALDGDLQAAQALFRWSQGEAIPADMLDLIGQLQECGSNGTSATTSECSDSRWEAVAALAARRAGSDRG